MDNATIQKILDIFHKNYPDKKLDTIWKIDEGFLLSAPTNENMFDEPYYFVNSDITDIGFYNIRSMETLFKAFNSRPLWHK